MLIAIMLVVIVVTFCGLTHDNYFRSDFDRLGSRAPQVGVARVSWTWSPGTRTFNFTTSNPFPAFLTPQSVGEGIVSGIYPMPLLISVSEIQQFFMFLLLQVCFAPPLYPGSGIQ